MFVKVVFILGLFAVATSVLPYTRRCDPQPKNTKNGPSHCSNYFNIEHIYEKEITLEKNQSSLQEKIAAVKNTGDSNHDDLVRLTAQLKAFEKRLSSIEEVEDDNSDKVSDKVAFSAQIVDGYNVFTGPRTSLTGSTLIFNKVFTNVGNAYNSKTGIFTTTVEGVYMFSFMTFGYHTHTSGAMLLKNGKEVVSTWESIGWNQSGSTSSTVVLEMKAKECVKIALRIGGKVHKAVFSGFLIYPMK